MSNEKKHDYRDTIKEAADLPNDTVDKEAQRALDRERKIDAEAAYETLAYTSSMGMLGIEEQAAGLMQMELAQELLYLFDNRDDNDAE